MREVGEAPLGQKSVCSAAGTDPGMISLFFPLGISVLLIRTVNSLGWNEPRDEGVWIKPLGGCAVWAQKGFAEAYVGSQWPN